MTAEPRFITGNAKDGSYWHKAIRRESKGAVTGAVLRVYYVARCSNRIPGGGYGATTAETIPSTDPVCPRCARFITTSAPYSPGSPETKEPSP